ncbi:uncharacterized protein LOC106053734 [Biomphalaria glabrata]|uniref:Uncharacterized protein LOC106053734 n=1 Tax=Biomphalaria glabrata TaxID=6526 RepID=A0A9W3A921_BIOGL|nr:uncharacterized protein LOC106053734 [Biomphalaria glabrata]
MFSDHHFKRLLLFILVLIEPGGSHVSVYPARRNVSTNDYFLYFYELVEVICSFNITPQTVKWHWNLSCVHNMAPFMPADTETSWVESTPSLRLDCDEVLKCNYRHVSKMLFQYHGQPSSCTVNCSCLSILGIPVATAHEELVFRSMPPISDFRSLEVKKCYEEMHWEGPSIATIVFILVISLCLLHYNTLPAIESKDKPIRHVSKKEKKYIMKSIYGEVCDMSAIPESIDSFSEMLVTMDSSRA